MSSLVRSETPGYSSLAELGSRSAELEARLATRGAEVARLRADLDAFGIGYHERVGLLRERLDELERAIAEAESGELAKLAKGGSDGPGASDRAGRSGAPRNTSDVVRRLFRDLAKAVHPDLARDTLTRNRRHALMVEANRAYALGDEERLRSILDAWERSPEAVPEGGPEAARLRLVRRIAQVEEELVRLADDLTALKTSPLGKLKALVDGAAARRRDLVGELVIRLNRDIMAAEIRLETIRPPA